MTPMRKIQWLVWSGLGVIAVTLASLWFMAQLQARTAQQEIIWVNCPLPDFTLTDQDGHKITLSDLRGQVWVADIIFTRCLGPCPLMTKRLSEWQPELAEQGVRLVTLTTDPENDTPAVMKQFGERFGANFKQWLFLTGTKKEIARLAVQGMKLVAQETKPEERENPEDLFIHSTRLVLVDKRGVMRATFDSDDPTTKAKLFQAIRKLQH